MSSAYLRPNQSPLVMPLTPQESQRILKHNARTRVSRMIMCFLFMIVILVVLTLYSRIDLDKVFLANKRKYKNAANYATEGITSDDLAAKAQRDAAQLSALEKKTKINTPTKVSQGVRPPRVKLESHAESMADKGNGTVKTTKAQPLVRTVKAHKSINSSTVSSDPKAVT